MAATFDLVLLHGPEFSGREIYHEKETASTHSRICPQLLYQQDADVGLRDVILRVIELMKEKKKVVVDDDTPVKNTRESYVRMIHRKLESKKIALVKVLPKFGCKQLYWSREFHVAEHWSDDSPPLHDANIHKWFDGENQKDVSYGSGLIHEPDEKEGFKIFETLMPLGTFSSHKFDVPALFIQWEGIISSSSDSIALHENVHEACKEWASVNPCGRIFILCEGSHNKQGTSNKEHKLDIITIVSDLVNKFDGCPVYVLFISSLLEAGSYVQPPNPGMLAYLQKLHNLSLHCKSTMYLYHSACHMKVAEEAGVRYIKVNRVLQQPSLVKTSHVCTTPSIPPFLKEIDIIQSQEATALPRIPLYCDVDRFKDHHVSVKMSCGRHQYLFAREPGCLERFNQEYVDLATRVDTPVSNIESACQCKRNEHHGDQENSGQRSKYKLSRSLSGDRGLPKWMLSNKKHSSELAKEESVKLSLSRTDSSSSNDGKIRHTVYVMTEKELTEVATDVLKQAGREDILKRVALENIRKKTSKNSPVKVSEAKDMSRGTVVGDTLVRDTVIGDTPQVPLPMMQDDVDMSGEEEMEINSSERDISVANQDDTKPVTKDTVIITTEARTVAKDTTNIIEETKILDDFLPDHSVRKSSPQKNVRMESVNWDISDEEDKLRPTVTNILNETFQTDHSPRKRYRSKISDTCTKNSPNKKCITETRDFPKKRLRDEQSSSSTKVLEQDTYGSDDDDECHSDISERQGRTKSVSVDQTARQIRPHLSILDEIFS